MVTLGTLYQRRHAEGKVSKSHRLEEHHPCSAELGSEENPSSGQLKARHHRLAHESMDLRVEVSECDSLNREETSTLNVMNS